MTRYISSIIVTVFFAVAALAFGFQLSIFAFAPLAQYIVLVFMLLFVVLTWVSDWNAANNTIGENLYYRVIAENGVFPIAGYAIQCVFAILYGIAWNTGPNPISTWLRLVLPKGLFIPLIIELIITAVVVVLWMGNNRANGHTVTQHVEQHNKIAQRDQFKGQVLLLKQRVDESDADKAAAMRIIEQKVASLPLNPNPSTTLFYQQAMQLVITANQSPSDVSLETLEGIKHAITMIR